MGIWVYNSENCFVGLFYQFTCRVKRTKGLNDKPEFWDRLIYIQGVFCYFFHVQILMLWYAIAILACALRSNGEDCNKQTTRDSCLTTKETRSLVVHGSQIKDSICVWCDQGCTTYNNNKCEPKAFLDALERAEPGKTKGYETCLVGNK